MCKISKGEKITMDFIEKCTFDYVHQYHVNIEHKSVVYSVFYDVYIPELNLFIEIHGAQHFGEGAGYFDHTPLIKRQEIDKIKQQYAEQHGHYMMVDYREHDPELTLKRFIDQFISFLEKP